MSDVLTSAQRKLNMSKIRGRDTKPEMVIRRGLHALGFRFRLHSRALPGRPDIVLPKYRAAVFVHGCFWHLHGCALSKMPTTRKTFWERKLLNNAQRDRNVVEQLRTVGWKVIIVWECALRGATRLDAKNVIGSTASAIRRSESGLLLQVEGQMQSTRIGAAR